MSDKIIAEDLKSVYAELKNRYRYDCDWANWRVSELIERTSAAEAQNADLVSQLEDRGRIINDLGARIEQLVKLLAEYRELHREECYIRDYPASDYRCGACIAYDEMKEKQCGS